MKHLFFFSLLTLLTACTHVSSTEEVAEHQAQFENDPFTLSGDYHWEFQLMGGSQHSVHTFFEDSIVYSMQGKVYNTDYTMQKLSFDDTDQKWIGRDENGIVYTLFFKDKTDTTLTIYKHKCKTNGVAEAIAFDLPKPDATDDHGWNVYTFGKSDQRDHLGVNGSFIHSEQTINLSDGEVVWNNKLYSKLSYHAGERRWVGQHGETYLQIFFKKIEDGQTLHLAVEEYHNLEKAYKVKFNEVAFTEYERQ